MSWKFQFMRVFLQIGLILVSLLTAGEVFAQSSAVAKQETQSIVEIDASKVPGGPVPLSFATGGRSPGGHVLSANSQYLTLDGTPWFPVMGEFHFTRYSEADWEEEILKMKAGGIGIVSTYIFWIHHEEIEGQFDWSGRRNLRRFVALCARHGIYVWIRIGPWGHGEVRNGGFPDWLLQKCPTRQNDPTYLRYVRSFYDQIGQQVKGLFWKDGGPIIGVQIENEYRARGPGKGAEHMLTLLGLARDAGIDAPFYTATAWDGVEFPPQKILPVFSGYADAFWSRKIEELPPNANYFFGTIRCEENVGDDLRSKRPDIDAQYASYPFLTAEMGGGMEPSYHRRPQMSGDDTAAMTLVKLGSGVTMYGYYMFHGGTNPEGKETTLQESQATGYPNDLPVRSYDYQAPLGEFGQMNSSFRDVKTFHLFLRDFGSILAPMTAYLPKHTPASKLDTKTPRVAARVEKNQGFIFLNNYQRTYPLPQRKNFQVRLKIASGVVQLPRTPVNIPTGAYTIWPVNLTVGGAVLQYATAQLLCKLADPSTYVFFAWPGLPAEFSFEEANLESIEAPHSRVTREGGFVYVDRIEPGTEARIRIRTRDHKTTEIVVLSREQARNIWKTTLAGRERLILSSSSVFFEHNLMHLRATDPSQLQFGVFPKPDRTPAGFASAGRDGIFEQYVAHVKPTNITATVEHLKEANPQPPVRMGEEVAAAPDEAAFDSAGRWSIRIPPVGSPDVKNVFLRITYEGDIARVYADGKLFTDDFFNGTPWEIGLGTLMSHEGDPELELRILPLRRDAPIYLPPGTRPVFSSSGEVARLGQVQIVPEYEAVADLNP
jgi:beta-galactosidase